eukprot:CAMPEP_0195539484 /NCGR_PEP_ID=MMETSP0794_2-20130614/50076_1 /TAXON_ID=515487 /ORGANISM="Stephanopyxis turris, Strain CCMP 815" /LENGTH=149 /DNA_ID=CAMNT_0040673515 /DNA_START=1 /DNA_END=450 /DNA_ORIENTATION=+
MQPQEHHHHQPHDHAARSFLQNHLTELSEVKARLGENHLEVADILSIIGLSYHHVSGDQDKALQFHKEALRVLKSCMDSSSERNKRAYISKIIAVTLTDIGNVHSKRGEFNEALASYDESLCIFQTLETSSVGHLVDAVMRGVSRIDIH